MYKIAWTKEYYTMPELSDFLTAVRLPEYKIAMKKGFSPRGYLDRIAVLDLETTSMEINGRKFPFAYVWMFGLDGEVIIGRTWDELDTLLDALKEEMAIRDYDEVIGSSGRILPVYIHNESFDFHFFASLRSWHRVFSTDSHKPIRANDVDGFEWRDSYVLSGLALKDMVPRCIALTKKSGDLDYSLIRHQETPLTDAEIGYCVADVRVLMGWLADKLDDNKDNLATIPMTRTGYVRREVRSTCFKDKAYRQLVRSMTMTPEQYRRLKQLFQGGFTHANAAYASLTLEDIQSYDITSSYPTAICSESFPMSAFAPYAATDWADIEQALKSCCCMFRLTMYDVEPKIEADNPISSSKCIELKNPVLNNGRVRTADKIVIECNEVDFEVYRKFYDFDFHVDDLEIAVRGYLPKPLIECVLKYYAGKTQLKGIPGQEVQYAKLKEYVNAIYGMMVTDPVKDSYGYDDAAGWYKDEATVEDAVDGFNRSKNRFLFYAWGVWVTSYARRNLFAAIEECGDDYVYSDTDSVKIMNAGDHKPFFDAYNKEIQAKIAAVCDHYRIDPALAAPLNKKGKPCPLGIWDDDGRYIRFRTLGAKRYLVEVMENGVPVVKSTVAGLAKKGLPRFLATLDVDPFHAFDDGLHVPEEYTGKLTHTYIDFADAGGSMEADVTDYLGNMAHVKSYGGVHLEAQSYDLGMGEYKDFLLSLYDREIGVEIVL